MLGSPGNKTGSRIAIGGVGDTNYYELSKELKELKKKGLAKPRDSYEMAIEASIACLDDAGITRDDVDGVILCRDLQDYEQFCYKMGITSPRLVSTLKAEGRMTGIAIQYAMAAIYAGQANNVLVVYSNNGGSLGMSYGGTSLGISQFDYCLTHGLTSYGAMSASYFSNYCHRYNINGPDLLGLLAVSNRYHATLNPRAVFKERTASFEDYINEPFIAEPLRRSDYCLVNDGAIALLVTSVDRAKNMKHPVVEIIASSACGALNGFYCPDDHYYDALNKVAKDLFATTGLKPSDINLLQIYDNFTPTVVYALEGLGFCGKGEALAYLKEKGLMVGKSNCPINTSGGHTSESYMQGFSLHAELVRQLRHECGERQVKDAKYGLYVIPSPIVNGHILVRA